jgi:hypothetical protein
MRKGCCAVALLTLGLYGSVVAVGRARNGVEAQDATRVVILPDVDAPITLDAVRVATDPSSVAFSATNTGLKKVRAYIVSAFWFPPAGQRHGFVSQEQQPPTSLGNGQVQRAVMPLPDRLQLGSETTVIVAVRSATFDDGTEWKDDEVSAQVNERARELKLP